MPVLTDMPLIDGPTLRAQLADALVFDCSHHLGDPGRGRRDHAEGHVPGALHLHLDEDLASRSNGRNGRHPLPQRELLATKLAAFGLSPRLLVVVYDRSDGVFAARAWWLLRWLGHARVALLDGGWRAWVDAGGAIETGAVVPRRPHGEFRAGAPLVRSVDVDEVANGLDDDFHRIFDARSPERYAGRGETLDPVGGHIPGAVSRFCRDNLRADGRFKAPAELRAEFLALLGDRAPADVVHQCGSGGAACLNLLAMECAGLSGSALYPGSWSEWCADPTRPVRRGSEP